MKQQTNFAPRGINVLGGPLRTCSTTPLTGFFRVGCCRTDATDPGVHSVCRNDPGVSRVFAPRWQRSVDASRNSGFAAKAGISGACAARWVEALCRRGAAGGVERTPRRSDSSRSKRCSNMRQVPHTLIGIVDGAIIETRFFRGQLDGYSMVERFDADRRLR
jgi:uncharacterized protein (DUF2237 family)